MQNITLPGAYNQCFQSQQHRFCILFRPSKLHALSRKELSGKFDARFCAIKTPRPLNYVIPLNCSNFQNKSKQNGHFALSLSSRELLRLALPLQLTAICAVFLKLCCCCYCCNTCGVITAGCWMLQEDLNGRRVSDFDRGQS